MLCSKVGVSCRSARLQIDPSPGVPTCRHFLHPLSQIKSSLALHTRSSHIQGFSLLLLHFALCFFPRLSGI